ncbi:hypothetical protein B9Z55_015453 [Caenorhabditis nigoni]|uniref:CCHC-type domain-containing protein n=1 Tax=Caenorhabditis nigoni TaxID=1611254 RepID=A0A2G5S961_9PELO|nr:hypothetical protein B9Z55_029078 [Caenorhabditis nigoni]PIC36478.1 hypothetical protein B9Z55_015453 [Caenorhabditis nigoni]
MDVLKSKYEALKQERDSMEVEIGILKMDLVVSEAERHAVTDTLKRKIFELEHGNRVQHPRIIPPSIDTNQKKGQPAPRMSISGAFGSRVTTPGPTSSGNSSHVDSLTRNQGMIGRGNWPKRGRQFASGCRLCKGPHAVVHCDQFSTIPARIEKFHSLRMCTNCLHHGHAVASCISKLRCQYCKQKHHASICSSQSASAVKEKEEKSEKKEKEDKSEKMETDEKPECQDTADEVSSDEKDWDDHPLELE